MDTSKHGILRHKKLWNTWIQVNMEYMDTSKHGIHGYKKSCNKDRLSNFVHFRVNNQNLRQIGP